MWMFLLGCMVGGSIMIVLFACLMLAADLSDMQGGRR